MCRYSHEFILCLSVFATIVAFGVLWFEDAWSEFYHWGPPFKVGAITIKTWWRWGIFLGLLILYQIMSVYIEETIGLSIERRRIQSQTKQFTRQEIFMVSVFNLYKWLGTILHIFVAVTRLDVWIALALMDTLLKTYLWMDGPSQGRKPRFGP